MKKEFLFAYFNVVDKGRRIFRFEFIHNLFHRQIINYIETNYSDIIDKYSEMNTINESEIESKSWTMWWQGESEMPTIVDICFQNNKNVLPNLVIITKDNYREFVDLPNHVIEKFKNGIIGMAQFSDIVRVNLLAKYGGLWIDSTIFLNDKSVYKNLIAPFWSAKGPDFFKGKYVPKGKWRGFIQYSQKNYAVQKFMGEMFSEYWKKEKKLINFFLIDYLYYIAYKHDIGNFKNVIDGIAYLSNNIYKLDDDLREGKKISLPSNEALIFKLNWKHDYSKSSIKDLDTIVKSRLLERK